MAITREEIVQAAEALERDGEKATMAAVREFLGGGSFATISPVLREWRDGRKTTQAVVLEMPGELKAVMERAGAELWQAASRLANEKLVTVQAEAEVSVSDARMERDEAIREVKRLEAALEELAALQARFSQQQGELIRLQAQLSASQQAVGQARDDLKRMAGEKDRLADDSARLQGTLAELKRERDETRAENKALTLDNGRLQGQLAQLEKQAGSAVGQ